MMTCMLRRYAGLREEFSFGRLDVTNAEGGGVIVGVRRDQKKGRQIAPSCYGLLCAEGRYDFINTKFEHNGKCGSGAVCGCNVIDSFYEQSSAISRFF